MKTTTRNRLERLSRSMARSLVCAIVVLALVPANAAAFNSNSTGADGALSPTVTTEIKPCSEPGAPPPCLPDSGILNLTSVNIPSGITVTFKRNATNTPVVLLVVNDVTIAGTLDVTGKPGTAAGAAGSGNLGDDGQPGAGGPGGFDGGRGGAVGQASGGGLGPGGGRPGTQTGCFGYPCGGGGGGFGLQGTAASYNSGSGGATYGSSLLLPLIGGSGGGGGAGGPNFGGAGGGGGGGAILIAASGSVTVAGTVRANGGRGGDTAGAGCGEGGGGGSGGGIRIVATTIAGNGTIQAVAGSQGSACAYGSGPGGYGRIRLESNVMQRTSGTDPGFTTGSPGAVSIAGSLTLLISSVAGVAAPATPTGSADIVLPASTPNPVTVVFTTHGVPQGNTVTLTVTPATGTVVSVVSPALMGTIDSATASVNVNLPSGPSVLAAMTTFTVTAAVGDALSRFAQGERVEKVTLVAKPGAASTAILHTVSGKTYEVAAALLPSGS